MPILLALLLGQVQDPKEDFVAFVGLHGGVFERLKGLEGGAGFRLQYLPDEAIARGEVDFTRFRVVVLQHLRGEDREKLSGALSDAKRRRPDLRIVALARSGTEQVLPELLRSGIVETDPKLSAYYEASDVENLSRMLTYIGIVFLGRKGEIKPPAETAREGLYHPDHPGLFAKVGDFLAWVRERKRDAVDAPRVVVAVHYLHLTLQQPAVVDALLRALEKQGMLAVAAIDLGASYEAQLREFKPRAFIHVCHSNETVALREEIGAPHLHSLFFRKQSIDQWRASSDGLPFGEFIFQGVAQEVLGAIEPQVGAGTKFGGGSSEAMTPIAERIEHLVSRTTAWVRLTQVPNARKKVAIVYYDREMGKAELMRGSATGMFMNAPRSMVNVLARMKADGYGVKPVPQTEEELLGWMLDHGRQIGVWAPGVLDRLARSGLAALVPAEKYAEWLAKKVPEAQQQDLIKRWGPAPGKFLVWEDGGRKFIVIPKVDLGGVLLLPQPLRGEAQDTSLVHDRAVPPPHNYLATYFWLQEEFKADAVVHFGTHGSEFALPGKSLGLDRTDWTDMILGAMPNINPWILNNLGESSPVRRRAYGVLIDHLVPPSVGAGLSDEILNIHNDIDKWESLEDGALKDKFRAEITRQVRQARVHVDVKIDLPEGRLLEPGEIGKVSEYLHEINNETTPISLHVFGEAPPEKLLIPYVVTCLRSRFLDDLGGVMPVPPGEGKFPGDRHKYLRGKAEEILEGVLGRGLSPEESLTAAGAKVGAGGLSKQLRETFELAVRIRDGLRGAPRELDGLMTALSGRYVAPGPGGTPDRNPAVLPTGRNMYLMNPEEVPSRASWEVGKDLVDRFLADQLKSKGRIPGKVGFTLSSFSTFQDFGVMEAQILYLLGVRPVWNRSNLVSEVELIPAKELGRSRVDVFIATNGYYRDSLPTRLQLIDRAVRLVSEIAEAGNPIRENSARVRGELEKGGLNASRSEALSRARIYGYAPGEFSTAGYYYLVEKSGEWSTREDLMKVYLNHVRYAYTEGLWGVAAPEAYDRHIQGTETVFRSWSDRTRSPLANKYDWWVGGSLTAAVKHLTGKEPEYFFSDVRDPDKTRMISAEDALRQEFRVRLFNRKWIEGMMKEGYAGADQIGVMVSNTMGWKVMREGSITDADWNQIVDVFIRDSKKLGIRAWMESVNPFAFQEITEILLESARKGYWSPDAATLAEVAREYARSVVKHGEGGGLRGGGNIALEKMVEGVLKSSGPDGAGELVEAFHARAAESARPQAAATATPPPPAPSSDAPVKVEGRKLDRIEAPPSTESAAGSAMPAWTWALAAALLLAALGYFRKTGGV